MKFAFCTLVLVVSQAHALSIHEAARAHNGMADPSKAMQNDDLFQGDIAGIDPNDRNAITSPKKLWTNGVVYFQISSELESIRHLILEAMNQYQRKTNMCIRFVESTGHGNYIRIFRHNGCYSYIGMTGGEQVLSLGRGCAYVGTIVHELGHALGLHHEQNRSDRDGYLRIHEENVAPNQRHNFRKLRPDQNFLMTPFDYNSIMEYGNKAFSMNGRPTIEVLQQGAHIDEPYNKKGLDEKDAFIINSLYSCQGYTRPDRKERADKVCNFEKDTCLFTAEQGSSRPVIAQEAGSSNHYLKAGQPGFYRIITPGMLVTSDVVCISFKYRVDGELDRNVGFIAYGRGFDKRYTLPKENTHGWKSVQTELRAPNDFRMYFDIFPTYGSSFGLDDFVYGQHPCKK